MRPFRTWERRGAHDSINHTWVRRERFLMFWSFEESPASQPAASMAELGFAPQGYLRKAHGGI